MVRTHNRPNMLLPVGNVYYITWNSEVARVGVEGGVGTESFFISLRRPIVFLNLSNLNGPTLVFSIGSDQEMKI